MPFYPPSQRISGLGILKPRQSRKYPTGGHRIQPKRLNDDPQKLLGRLKLPTGRDSGFTVHSFRHFFKTFTLNTGIPKPAVDARQGHSALGDMSSHYYRLSDEDSKKLMEKVPFGTGMPAANAGDSVGGSSHDPC